MIKLENNELLSISGGGWGILAAVITGIIWIGGMFVGYVTGK